VLTDDTAGGVDAAFVSVVSVIRSVIYVVVVVVTTVCCHAVIVVIS